MRVRQWVLMAGLVAGLPAVAAAQVTTTDPGSTTTTTTTTSAQTTQTFDDDDDAGDADWYASGFVGSAFGIDADEPSIDFGGTIGHLWEGVLGVEFAANLAPDFELEPARRALLFGDRPWVNSYMANLVAAIPIGGNARVQPFVSGGLGAMTLQAATISTDSDGDGNEFQPDDTRFAGNIGGGFMGFGGNVGFRADVRYFRGFGDNFDLADLDSIDSAEEAVGNRVLSGLDFWRANVGLAFRW